MSEELAGKVAIVTGAASGIGRATAELFIEEGAKVVIADVDPRGEEIAKALGKNARFKRTDVSNEDDVQALVDFAVAEFGGLHIMFNNAGVSTKFHARFIDDELKDFQRVMGVNLLGVMLGTQRAARHMAKHGGGSIINTSSISGEQAGFGVMTYRASKAGVIQFSRSVAIDFAEYDIRVNCILPGHIPTEMTAFSEPGISAEKAERLQKEIKRVYLANQPLKRRGAPRDVANAAVYLGSDRSVFVTGLVIAVDGGTAVGDPVNHIQELAKARAAVLAS